MTQKWQIYGVNNVSSEKGYPYYSNVSHPYCVEDKKKAKEFKLNEISL